MRGDEFFVSLKVAKAHFIDLKFQEDLRENNCAKRLYVRREIFSFFSFSTSLDTKMVDINPLHPLKYFEMYGMALYFLKTLTMVNNTDIQLFHHVKHFFNESL
jgi:hypothetical protein